MAPKIPQKGDPNPNPQELPSEVKKECDDENRIRLRAANIKIFKAVVMKIAGSAPNKRSLKRCINQLCSNQRTPDHPPYATVIGSSIFPPLFLFCPSPTSKINIRIVYHIRISATTVLALKRS